MATTRFQPLFTKPLPSLVKRSKKLFDQHKKEWNDNMVAQALIHSVDISTAPVSLVNAWNKMRPATQRSHALKALQAYMSK